MIEVNLKNQTTLLFTGVLEREAVPLLWEQLSALNNRISFIDVSGIERIDSAGLAFLVYLANQYNMTLLNRTEQLEMLIELYNLKSVLAS